MLKVIVGFQPTAGHEGISDTNSGSVSELHSDVKIIIFL